MSHLIPQPVLRQNTLLILHKSWKFLLPKIKLVIHICVFVLTTPWEFLRMPIIHILKMPPSDLRIQKVKIWCINKESEYQYVAMSGAVVASAVTASFSWDGFHANASWFTVGTWYGSIIFSLLSVTVAFQHILLFANFGTHPEGLNRVLEVISRDGLGLEPDLLFVYVLQVPGMLLSFSLISYFVGLSMLIVFPLWEEGWDSEMKTAAVYLAYLVFSGLNYVFVCSVVYTKTFTNGREKESNV